MKRILATQRVDVVERYGERRDALDQQWTVLLETMGCILFPVPNTLDCIAEYIEAVKPEGILLTGGNDLTMIPDGTNISPERDITESGLLDYAAQKTIPVFGVCRGAQMINTYCGGKLTRISNHAGTRHTILWEGISSINITERNSFHNYGISCNDLSADLSPIAFGEDNSVEAFCHNSLPWFAVMWHPEREFPFLPEDAFLLEKTFRGDELA